MKCEECLQWLEPFFDNEADDLISDRISKHIAGCDACARRYENLSREQEFFRRHEYNVEAPHAFWKGVSARIADENAARAGWFPRTWQTRLLSLLTIFTAPRFSPVLTSALVLVAIVITIGFMREGGAPESAQDEMITSTAESPAIIAPARSDITQNEIKEDAPSSGIVIDAPVVAARKATAAKSKIHNVKASRKSSHAPREPTPAALIRDAERKYLTAIAMLTENAERRRLHLDAGTAARFEQTLAAVDRTIAGTRRAARENPEDPVAAQFMLMSYAKKVDVLREMAAH